MRVAFYLGQFHRITWIGRNAFVQTAFGLVRGDGIVALELPQGFHRVSREEVNRLVQDVKEGRRGLVA